MRYVYVIRNLINDKVYVGQTKDPTGRKKSHWHCARANKRGHLYDSMRKYGLENFTFTLLEECEIEVVDERERYWISQYQSQDRSRGYNSDSGGCLSKTLSEEHKRATSEGLKRYMAQRGEWHPTDEQRRNMSEAQKISRSRYAKSIMLDASHPDAQPKTCPVCNGTYVTKTLSPHDVIRHQAKRFCSRACVMRNENLTRNSTPERRAKISLSRRGKKLSVEHRQKIKEGMLRRHGCQ